MTTNMLKQLTIQNFVIAESLRIDFEQGMCVLTGETGAGKSLIVDAILGVLGQRVAPDTIRQGAEFAYLEAVFEINKSVQDLLRSRAYEEVLGGDYLILSKTIYPSGSRSRLNGQLVTQSLIRELANLLIDSIGQHENQALFMEDAHLSMLDELGASAHQKLLQELAQVFGVLQQTRRERLALAERQREQERQKDFMSFQLEEIQSAELRDGEEDELTQERDRLRYAEKILQSSSEAYASLCEHPHGQSVCEQIEAIQRLLGSASRFDQSLDPLIESLENALVQLQESGRELADYIEGLERNPARLEEIETRLDTIKRLKHKYGADIPAILAFAQNLAAELSLLEHAEANLLQLESYAQKLESEYLELAQKLSASRLALVKQLEPRIEAELKELGMAKTRFCVEVEHDPERWHEEGQERVRFLMSPNPGEPLRPLARIASGGEASRLLLAFKLVLKRSNPVPTLIFDEVDTGISGKAALVVSHKLARLAREHQILCISHLPVIAAMADQHLWIEKQTRQQQTRIQLSSLSPQERSLRLAQMSSGQVTDTSLESAQEIYQHALAFKSQLETGPKKKASRQPEEADAQPELNAQELSLAALAEDSHQLGLPLAS